MKDMKVSFRALGLLLRDLAVIVLIGVVVWVEWSAFDRLRLTLDIYDF